MSSFSLTISPAQLDIAIKPNSTFSQAYTISNDSDQPITLTATVEGWLPKNNDGTVEYCGSTCPTHFFETKFSLGNSDIHLGDQFVINPHSKKQLVLKIQTGSTLSDSYHTLFLNQISPVNNSEDSISQSIGRLGSHILISTTNTDTPTQNLTINQIKITPLIKDSFFTPLNFNIIAENSSQYFFPIIGDIIITKNGNQFKKLTIAPQNLLPQTPRKLQCLNQDKEIIPCQISPPFWPGLYQITIKTDPSIVSSSPTVLFFVMPLSILLPIFFLIISFFIFKIFKNKTSITK